MSKKGLLLAGIMCGVLTSTLMVAHCGECDCTVKDECGLKADKRFVAKAVIEYYKSKRLGNTSQIVKKNYDKACSMIARGIFDSVLDGIEVIVDEIMNNDAGTNEITAEAFEGYLDEPTTPEQEIEEEEV